ncbi:Ig-like domain-containing protein [Flavobacterium sp. GSB-24]|uniref:Ig-like domain-containing protein n=1 Tax=Flavobacterium sp. GSB-24 TaxID=2994319 RepID=UPI0024917535|nr:Ig-like domain-containing protein [Flavobacterium sp. GSB-24]BDU25811.1 hypothetical protein FLGSB24_25550 [Flavobacterium sp. GSB-24]
MKKIKTLLPYPAFFYSSLLFLLFNFTARSQNYQLVWSDDFNGTGAPDSNKWGYELGGNIRNSELQYYTNSLNNVKQNNGNLEITVIKEDFGGKQYTSGSVISLNKFSVTYGKIEGRFKMPNGKGLWACFWTLGSNFPQIGWPKCGEIDIFEHLNSETMVHGTTHWAGANEIHVQDGSTYNVDVTQWHVYSITWDANYIKWYVDDILYKQFRVADGYNFTGEFHKPHYILINLPIGGTWPGPPDATTVLPATMYCDYVKVYKDTDNTQIAATGFSISPNTLTLNQGGKQVINTAFVPANTTNQIVSWSSSNSSVAIVNNWGLVTGTGIGAATITATASNGSTATCSVSVQNLANVNKLVNGNFDANTTATQTPIGWSEWGSASNAQTSAAAPYSPAYKGIQWGTTAYEVAVFQSLTGIANGNYTMKAWVRSSGGQNFATMYAKGYGGTDQNYSVAASIPNWTQIQINNIKVTNNTCELGFYQSAKANNWLDYDNVEFYLSPVAITAFGISQNSMTMPIGTNRALNTVFTPVNATDQNVVWTSSNNAVATVNNLGIITAVGVGTVTITATASDGKTANCSVSVQDLVNFNKLNNGNFEANTTTTQTPTGWTEYGTGSANAQTSTSSPHSGTYKGTQSSASAFEVAVFQSLTYIVNGNYTMKAWVRSSGGQSTALMYAKNYGGNPLNYYLNTSIPNWTQVQINNIIVTNNSCELGFYQYTGTADKWLDYDDVEFYLTSAGSANTLSLKNVQNLNSEVINASLPVENFVAYPNPVKSGSTLNISSNDEVPFDIFIINMNGETIFSKLNNYDTSTAVPISNLNKGVYFLRTTNSLRTRIQKIFVE